MFYNCNQFYPIEIILSFPVSLLFCSNQGSRLHPRLFNWALHQFCFFGCCCFVFLVSPPHSPPQHWGLNSGHTVHARQAFYQWSYIPALQSRKMLSLDIPLNYTSKSKKRLEKKMDPRKELGLVTCNLEALPVEEKGGGLLCHARKVKQVHDLFSAFAKSQPKEMRECNCLCSQHAASLEHCVSQERRPNATHTHTHIPRG